jgi:predicted enzyme related to lactoylglutathione lyase
MANEVVHFEVVGNDGPALMEFYRSLFGWKVDADNPMNYGIVEGGEGGIGGGVSASPDGPGVTFYVQVDDPQAYLDKAEKLGGRVVMPVMEIPGAVTMAQFADIEGNVIGIVKAGPPPEG